MAEQQRNDPLDAIENPNVGENQNVEPHEEGAVGGVNMGGRNNPLREVAGRLIVEIFREGQDNNAELFGDDDDEDDENEDLPALENVQNGHIVPNENPIDDMDDEDDQ